MNWLKNLCNYIKKTLFSSSTKMGITELKGSQHSVNAPEPFSRFYTFDDIPLKNFDKCINGNLEYMTYELVLQPESQLRFMDIYFRYIDEVGGGNEWAMVNREYVDLKIRSLILLFAKEMLENGTFESSKIKQSMIDYDYTLPVGHELAMIDSYLASLQISLDAIIKQVKRLNKVSNGNSSLVKILTQINTANKLYLPYNSILLTEFIEAYQILKENQKNIKNGRLNHRNS